MKPNNYDWLAEQAEWVFVPTATAGAERQQWTGLGYAPLCGAAVLAAFFAWAAWRLTR
jgi:hypothetical protein